MGLWGMFGPKQKYQEDGAKKLRVIHQTLLGE
jgi:hypothetical protein